MRKYYAAVTSFLTPTSFQWHEFPTWIAVHTDRKEIFTALLDTGSKQFCEGKIKTYNHVIADEARFTSVGT